ncbi:MAG TPA: FecR domain-containing protein [Terriglobia bacterium]|nr:FecR domain-containing protein [Terriglobia bacterium]
MKYDYLWDGSGEPDPEVQHLETVLATLRSDRPAPEFPAAAESGRREAPLRVLRARWLTGFAAAAASVLVAGAYWLEWRKPAPAPAVQTGWTVAILAGAPSVGSKGILDASGKLSVGQTLETDGRSRARLAVGDVGEVEVEPNTRLRLLRAGAGRKRLALDRGTIHAAIWAPPGEFVVDTPSAVAVDLGCAYTLQVDDSGAGLLRTTLGWVGFKLGSREAFIPAGAVCATRPDVGPGTPYFEDAPAPLRAALTRLDFGGGTAALREADVAIILSQSRRRDALTLWHLLTRVDGPERGRVYDRLAALARPPSQVTRAGVLHLDSQMLDLWWNQLGFGDISLWRTYERSWSRDERGAK